MASLLLLAGRSDPFTKRLRNFDLSPTQAPPSQTPKRRPPAGVVPWSPPHDSDAFVAWCADLAAAHDLAALVTVHCAVARRKLTADERACYISGPLEHAFFSSSCAPTTSSTTPPPHARVAASVARPLACVLRAPLAPDATRALFVHARRIVTSPDAACRTMLSDDEFFQALALKMHTHAPHVGALEMEVDVPTQTLPLPEAMKRKAVVHSCLRCRKAAKVHRRQCFAFTTDEGADAVPSPQS